MITATSTREPGRRHLSTARRRRLRLVGSWATVLLATGLSAVVGMNAASAATPTVLVATNPTFGPILTNSAGMALYTLNTDHNGQSTCHGSCAAVWPPLNVPAGTVVSGGPGVTGVVGTATQSNGTIQVTYNGAPLYTFVSDTAPGQVTGNNVTGFFVVTVAAATTTTTAPAGPAPTGTAPTGTGAAPGGSPGAVTPTATGPAPGTAPASASSPTVSSTPGSLAFTGTGTGLLGLGLAGLALVVSGTLLLVGPVRRRKHPVRVPR